MYKYNRTKKTKIDYAQFRTEVSKRRRSAATRELTKIAYSAPHSIISLAEGMPNEETFPFSEISIKLVDGSDFVLEGEDLAASLQYIPSQGYPPLLQAIREFQRKAHSPPMWENREVVIVAGGQDGLSKALEAIIGPSDPILVQNPFYPGASVVIAPHEAELIPIEQDELGLIPQCLRERLKERKASGLKMPKLMYINATGANPTGTVMPLERRHEIYRLACEYNFLILDDDPYHFMYFTDEAPTSFLALDTESRVIRVDSFSKVLSSGLRIGVITAAKPLVATIELHMQSSHLHAPTLSQVILYKLLQIWGFDKMMDHFRKIRVFYKERRDLIAKLAAHHLQGIAEFSVPSAGFFLWIKVPGVQDTWKMVMQRGIAHGVLVAPGAAFMADPSEPCNAIRASFAKATYKEMNLAMERLSLLIKDELSRSKSILPGNT
ncbi:kynurenine/alpha-aminoadipate aminotransferase, mitochondrial-like isoform X1 [Copidosoma floridanum]|uniref:kynurenine/alpha-aminoadipate aminotransferase, mitochondrial-like isoform X1 n=1 Tax=Copidosoma floridanum TaxID=29053 RepID=UPI0006C96DCE|nr:kynurenine/alpha-aminoadipate aminotransferase, mitochondrial-like isoform X1 [Copidosoma floridanum]